MTVDVRNPAYVVAFTAVVSAVFTAAINSFQSPKIAEKNTNAVAAGAELVTKTG